MLTVSGKATVTLRGETDTVVENGEAVTFEEIADLTGGIVRSNPSPPADGPEGGDIAGALAAGDADLALDRLLSLEERSLESAALRSKLRGALVKVTEAAKAGLGDPRDGVAPFVDLLLELRADARAEKRFAESDRIRDALTDLGVEVRDTPDGVEWDLEA